MTPTLEYEYQEHFSGGQTPGQGYWRSDKWLIVYAVCEGIRVEIGRQTVAEIPVKPIQEPA